METLGGGGAVGVPWVPPLRENAFGERFIQVTWTPMQLRSSETASLRLPRRTVPGGIPFHVQGGILFVQGGIMFQVFDFMPPPRENALRRALHPG